MPTVLHQPFQVRNDVRGPVFGDAAGAKGKNRHFAGIWAGQEKRHPVASETSCRPAARGEARSPVLPVKVPRLN